MARAKPGPVQIRLTLLDAEGLSSRVRQQEFVWVVHVLHLTELSSSSLLNHIASPEYLHCGFCVAAPVRHFDQKHL